MRLLSDRINEPILYVEPTEPFLMSATITDKGTVRLDFIAGRTVFSLYGLTALRLQRECERILVELRKM